MFVAPNFQPITQHSDKTTTTATETATETTESGTKQATTETTIMSFSSYEYRLCALVTVLVYGLNTRSGVAVGMAREKYNVPLPNTKGPQEFERIFRAHSNNAEQYPQFLALMWVFAAYVNADAAGWMGLGWVVCRHLYVSAYHKGNRVQTYTIPAYLVLSSYSVGIVGVVVWSFIQDFIE